MNTTKTKAETKCYYCQHPVKLHDNKWGCKHEHGEALACLCYSGDGKTHEHEKGTSCSMCLSR